MKNNDFFEITSSDIEWQRFANKTVLITGANGFLPAYMVDTIMYLNDELLKKTPCKIIAFVRNSEHAKYRFSKHLNSKSFVLAFGDVSNPLSLNCHIDFIIHAASPASPKYYNNDPVGVILPNVFGTKNTLELAAKNSVEGYLYFSSGEVYGLPINDDLIDENSYGFLDPTQVRSCYGESKRMGETLCISYGHQYDIPVKIVRPFHTYGPGMKLDDGRVFADFVNNIVNNKNIELKSDGSAYRVFCYLSDAVSAFFKVLLEGENSNAYNVANPEQTVSIKDLATTLVGLFPEKNLEVITAKQDANYLKSELKKHIPDISKIQKLGWSPKISIKEGFIRTVRSYQ